VRSLAIAASGVAIVEVLQAPRGHLGHQRIPEINESVGSDAAFPERRGEEPQLPPSGLDRGGTLLRCTRPMKAALRAGSRLA